MPKRSDKVFSAIAISASIIGIIAMIVLILRFVGVI